MENIDRFLKKEKTENDGAGGEQKQNQWINK